MVYNGYQKLICEYPMAKKEYLPLKLSDMPDGVIEKYGLCEKATKDG